MKKSRLTFIAPLFFLAAIFGACSRSNTLTPETALKAVEEAPMFSADACVKSFRTGSYSVGSPELEALRTLATGGFITLTEHSTTDSLTAVSVELTPEGLRYQAEGSSYIPDAILSDNDLATGADVEAMVQSTAAAEESVEAPDKALTQEVHKMIIGRFVPGKVEEITPDSSDPSHAEVVFTYRFTDPTPFGAVLGTPAIDHLRQGTLTLRHTEAGWTAE